MVGTWALSHCNLEQRNMLWNAGKRRALRCGSGIRDNHYKLMTLFKKVAPSTCPKAYDRNDVTCTHICLRVHRTLLDRNRAEWLRDYERKEPYFLPRTRITYLTTM